MRIALLDPQHARAEHYRTIFTAGGYRCQPFMRVQPFLAATLRDTFDLAVIVGPAREPVLRQALVTLTRRAVVPPVLMLSTHAVEADMIDLLDAGVDDCLPEPAGEDWLLARTRALLRRTRTTQPSDMARTHFDGYRFDPVRCRVETPGATITLTPKELALALLLFRNPGRDLSRQYLVDGVWARESGPSSRSLDTHISRIRQKLSLQAEYGYQLTAIYSHGYRLDRVTAEVTATRRLPSSPAKPPEETASHTVPTAEAPVSAPVPARAPASVKALAPAAAIHGPTAPGADAIALPFALPPHARRPALPLAQLFAHGGFPHGEFAHGGAAHDTSVDGQPARHDKGDAEGVRPADAVHPDSPAPLPG